MKAKENSASEGILDFAFSSIIMISASLHFHTTKGKPTAHSILQETLYWHTSVLVLAGIGLIFFLVACKVLFQVQNYVDKTLMLSLKTNLKNNQKWSHDDWDSSLSSYECTPSGPMDLCTFILFECSLALPYKVSFGSLRGRAPCTPPSHSHGN